MGKEADANRTLIIVCGAYDSVAFMDNEHGCLFTNPSAWVCK
jgi:hypothetical protein